MKFFISESGTHCLPFSRLVLTERKPGEVLEKPEILSQ